MRPAGRRDAFCWERHDEKEVVFRYRDGPTDEPRTARVPPLEFVRRLLLHVLPKGFRKVRHCGPPTA